MKPEFTSIDDEAHDNSTGWFGALYSRLRSFIEKYREPVSPGERALFGRKAANFVIFCALFVAVLTVFVVSLLWFDGGSHKAADAQINQPASKSKAAETQASPPLAPAQPAGPAGHAEVRPQSAPATKTDSK